MDVASEHSGGVRAEHKYSDRPIGYINVRRRDTRQPQAAIDLHQSEEEDELARDDARDIHASQGEFCSAGRASFLRAHCVWDNLSAASRILFPS